MEDVPFLYSILYLLEIIMSYQIWNVVHRKSYSRFCHFAC